MSESERYVEILEGIINNELLPIYNVYLGKLDRKPETIHSLICKYKPQPVAALLQPKIKNHD